MPPQTISLSMMHFERDELMSVEPEQGSMTGQLVHSSTPLEVDLMLSLVAQPESLVLDEYRSGAPERMAG